MAKPDVRTEDLVAGDDVVILASDGLWDVLSNQDACALVRDIPVRPQLGLPVWRLVGGRAAERGGSRARRGRLRAAQALACAVGRAVPATCHGQGSVRNTYSFNI